MLQRPNNLAICLNAPTLERALEQKELLIALESEFNVEWDIRAERMDGRVISYSQMINEAVLATKSEFMIFLNPGANPSVEDVNTIVDDLCNGYAMSNIIAFGFYGLTKEVFRRIGMMDERFIGGNHEDTDFLIRLKQNNFAVNYRYVEEKYLYWGFGTAPPPKYTSQFSGLAVSLFPLKWYRKDQTFYRTDLFLKEKQPPSNFLKNKKHYIFESWKSWENSTYDLLPEDNIFTMVRTSNISNTIATSHKSNTNGILKIISKDKNEQSTTAPLNLVLSDLDKYQPTRGGNLLFFDFIVDKPVELVIQLLDKFQQPVGFLFMFLKGNHFKLDDFDIDICDIKVFHGGRLLLHHNNFSMLGAEESYTLGLDVYEFTI